MNEVRSFVEGGLRDISISRKSIKWGIPWPGDPEHVFYVWYDALTSYMTGIGYGEGEDGEANPQFKKYWPARCSAHDRQGNYPLPRRVLARIPDGRRTPAAQSKFSPTAGCSSSRKR